MCPPRLSCCSAWPWTKLVAVFNKSFATMLHAAGAHTGSDIFHSVVFFNNGMSVSNAQALLVFGAWGTPILENPWVDTTRFNCRYFSLYLYVVTMSLVEVKCLILFSYNTLGIHCNPIYLQGPGHSVSIFLGQSLIN